MSVKDKLFKNTDIDQEEKKEVDIWGGIVNCLNYLEGIENIIDIDKKIIKQLAISIKDVIDDWNKINTDGNNFKENIKNIVNDDKKSETIINIIFDSNDDNEIYEGLLHLKNNGTIDEKILYNLCKNLVLIETSYKYLVYNNNFHNGYFHKYFSYNLDKSIARTLSYKEEEKIKEFATDTFIEEKIINEEDNLVLINIYGEGGIGKTHLLLEICQKIMFEKNQIAIYISDYDELDKYINEYKLKEYRGKLILLFDDCLQDNLKRLETFFKDNSEIMYNNIKIISTSRKKMNTQGAFNSNGSKATDCYQYYKLEELSKEDIKDYLSDNGYDSEDISDYLLDILKIPLYLVMYLFFKNNGKLTQKFGESENKIFRYYDIISSPVHILWNYNLLNYYICSSDNIYIDEEIDIEVLFFYFLPYVSYYLVKTLKNKVDFSEMKEIVSQYNKIFSDNKIFIDNKTDKTDKTDKIYKGKLENYLSVAVKMGILVRQPIGKNIQYSIVHDYIKEFFSAVNMFNNDIYFYVTNGKNDLLRISEENLKIIKYVSGKYKKSSKKKDKKKDKKKGKKKGKKKDKKKDNKVLRDLDINSKSVEFYVDLFDKKLKKMFEKTIKKNVYRGNILGDIYCYGLYKIEKDRKISINDKLSFISTNITDFCKGYNMYIDDSYIKDNNFGVWSKAYFLFTFANLFNELKDYKKNIELNDSDRNNLEEIVNTINSKLGLKPDLKSEKIDENIKICVSKALGMMHKCIFNCEQAQEEFLSLDELKNCSANIRDEAFEMPKVFNLLGNIYNRYDRCKREEHREKMIILYKLGCESGVSYCYNSLGTIYENMAKELLEKKLEDKDCSRCRYYLYKMNDGNYMNSLNDINEVINKLKETNNQYKHEKCSTRIEGIINYYNKRKYEGKYNIKCKNEVIDNKIIELEKEAFACFYNSYKLGDKWALRKICEFLIKRDNDEEMYKFTRYEQENDISSTDFIEGELKKIKYSNLNGVDIWLNECEYWSEKNE